MTKYLTAACAGIMVTLFLSSASVFAAEAAPPPTTSDILLDIQKIKSETDGSQRAKLADAMADDVVRVRKAHAMDSIDHRVIDELIALLCDDDDEVRADAASAIGFFGRRARRAAPALERALDRIREENKKSGLIFRSGVDSSNAIVPALELIKGVPESEVFDDPPN